MTMQSSAVHLPDRIILASASPRRRELIQSFGFPVSCQTSYVDEDVPVEWHPIKVVEELALRKARAIYKLLSEEWSHDEGETFIVGADTIVALDGEVLGKPTCEADAASMLNRLQGRSHEVYTGIALIRLRDGETNYSHGRTTVTFKPMSEAQIDRYVQTGEPMDKAGAYAIQGLLSSHIAGIDGCYFNVVGFSLSVFSDLLASFGLEAW